MTETRVYMNGRRIELSPSILAADFNRLGEQIQEVKDAGCTYLHVDVMDGMFVPSISLGMPVLASIRKETDLYFDTHLMVTDPIRYVEDFAKSGADMITVHVEACPDVEATLETIRKCGKDCGLVVCPETPVDTVYPYLDQIKMVLIMTVHPGFGGQKYIPECTKKISDLRAEANRRKLPLDIEVDGGVYTENVQTVIQAGANVIVAGSGVFHGNIKENIQAFYHIFEEY